MDYLHAAERIPVEKKTEELKEPSQKLAAKALGIEHGDLIVTARKMLEEHGQKRSESEWNIRQYIQKHFPDDPEGWRKVPNELTYFPANISEEMKQILFEYKQNPDYRAEEYVQFYWLIVNDFSGMNKLQKKLDAVEADLSLQKVAHAENWELMQRTVASSASWMAVQYLMDTKPSQKKSTSPEFELVKAEFERGKMVQQMMQQILQTSPPPVSKRPEKADANRTQPMSSESMTTFMANFMTQFPEHDAYSKPMNLHERLAELRARAVDFGDEGREFFPGDPKIHYTAERKRAFLDKIAATLV